MLSQEDSDFLKKVDKWRSKSDSMLASYRARWTKNLKLKFGIFSEDTNTRSKVRKVDKIFFRKIWATEWRLLAAFYNAFLRDQDSFRIEGRDKLNDWQKAGVLEEIIKFRRDQATRKDSLFIKHIWAFQDILDHGVCFGKLRWIYKDGEDKPDYVLYPVEQVFPDLSAETPEQMRYCIFENYMTKEEMEELGYENIDKAQPTSPGYSSTRETRHNIHRSPQNFTDDEYPEPGSVDEEKRSMESVYRVSEVFYRDDGMKFCVVNEDKCILKKEEESPYGDRIPLVMGQCYTVAHRLIGEGLAEPLEGPQESYNYNLNQRKDNIALALNKQTVVSRFGNVDLQSLINSKPGGVTLADDPSAVVDRQIGDVTQSSYVEAGADAAMMEEMSGVTPGKMGMGKEEKATVAQINYSESNAKIDLLIAIVGETYWKSFYSILGYLIQRFETDETVFRIANSKFQTREEVSVLATEQDLDFDADCIVEIGPGTVGREFEIRQTMLAIDRAILGNQAIGSLLQTGVLDPKTTKFINIGALMEDLLPKLGKKSTDRYFIQAQPPQQQGGIPNRSPQKRNIEMLPEPNMQEGGGLGPV